MKFTNGDRRQDRIVMWSMHKRDGHGEFNDMNRSRLDFDLNRIVADLSGNDLVEQGRGYNNKCVISYSRYIHFNTPEVSRSIIYVNIFRKTNTLL